MRDTIFRQYDSRWGNLAYPTKAYSFANNGCGCCSVTHLIIEKEQYKNYTPKEVRKYMVEKGYATKGHGTLWDGITETLRHYQMPSVCPDTMTEAFQILDKFKSIGILLMKAGTKGGVRWTSGGHYIAFLDYKVDKKGKHWFYIKDSGARNLDGWFCYEDHMKGLIKHIWIVDAPKPKRGKYYQVGKTYIVLSGRNVRTGGAIKYKKVGYLKKGTKIKCLQTSKNGRWIKHGTFRWSCGRSVSGTIYIK